MRLTAASVRRRGPLQVHTTSLVSGLLFIVVGAVFMRYEGTGG